jgi:hypothetical protein
MAIDFFLQKTANRQQNFFWGSKWQKITTKKLMFQTNPSPTLMGMC